MVVVVGKTKKKNEKKEETCSLSPARLSRASPLELSLRAPSLSLSLPSLPQATQETQKDSLWERGPVS